MKYHDKILCEDLTPVATVHKNPWFTVNDRGGYFTTEPNEMQIAVLPIIENSEILLVKAKRPVINDTTWELPAGGGSENETPEEAAARELKEEAGVIVDIKRLKRLKPLSVCPNRHPFHPHIFQVNISCSEYEQRHPFDGEICDVQAFSFSEIKKMIVEGELYITLPTTIIARFLLSTF